MTRENQKYICLATTISKHSQIKGVTDGQMAATLGIAERTYSQKRLHPERFTYPEFIRLCSRLELTDAEILEAVR